MQALRPLALQFRVPTLESATASPAADRRPGRRHPEGAPRNPNLAALRTWLLSLACVWGIAGFSQNAPPPSAGPQTAAADAPRLLEAVSVKSVFVDDPRFGKDPFFPQSTRRQPAKPVQATGPVTEAPELALFSVRGISGPAGSRLALISDGRRSRSLAEGEEVEVKLNDRTCRVRCVEIRDRSVVISVNGATKELTLRSGL